MKDVTAILLAAGRGRRLQSDIPKLLVRLNSQPVIIYSLKALSSHPYIKDIIVVAHRQNRTSILGAIYEYRIAKVIHIVEGGLRRQDSVHNALKALPNSSKYVLIHDAARPFIGKEIISKVISAAKKSGAAIVGVPVKATIKKVKGNGARVKRCVVEKTIDRNSLWEIQTPQVFIREVITKAYRKYAGSHVTDDASLVEKLKRKVVVVPGSYSNIKITTPDDLIVARAFAQDLRQNNI